MKTYGAVDVEIHEFLTSTLFGGQQMYTYRSTYSWPPHYLQESGQLHAPAALPPGKDSPVESSKMLHLVLVFMYHDPTSW
jgi:hypothetical protein